MNFVELKDELYARGTDYLSEDAAGVARAERWLNQGYREILNLQAWTFLYTLTTGPANSSVNIPDLRRVLYVVDTANGNQALTYVNFPDLITQYGEDAFTDTGTPSYYYIINGTVYPHPFGGTLKVAYIKRVAPMTGTDTPIFDEEYHNLIVDKAMIRAYIDSDNYEAAQALQSQVDLTLQAMSEDYATTSRETQFIIPAGDDV